MKKNGYLRRFLALFLALVMIMADSSVTTFAATVGRVKQKSAAAETENQQTVYTYEDSKVTVTATLENADAVPDNAKFVAGEEVDERYWKHVSDNGDNVRRNQRNSEAYSIWDRASQLDQRYHRNKKND